MAGKTYNSTIKFTGQFDSSGITKGLQDIKKQMSNSHIGDDLRKQLETALNKVEANIPALEKMSAKGEFNEKELIAYQKLIQEISKDMANLSKITAEADFTKNFSTADNEKLKQFEKQLNDVEKKLKTTRQEILNTFSKSKEGQINGKSNATLNSFIEQLISVPPDKIKDKLDEIIKEVESQTENTVEKLQEDFKNKVNHKTGKEGFIELLFGKDSGVSLKEGKTLGFSKVTGDEGAYSVYSKIRDDILKLKQDASAEDVQKILDNYSKFIQEYFNIPEGKKSILANIVTPEILNYLKQFVGEEGLEKLKNLLGKEQIKILADGEAEKIQIAANQANFMKQVIDELTESGKITKEQAEAIMQALGLLNKQVEEGSEKLGKEKAQADALSATFGSLAKRITNSVSALTVFNKTIQVVHRAIASVKELDAAFTQIAIVSEKSNEEAWQMFESFNNLAKQYSITTKDLTEGAKLFYQQGLSAADTMKMVEASTISAALGEVTMTEAANTLTAAIQGYNESASVAMDYTDKIAMVGAVSAADFNELSAAMEKTASSAYTAGIDFDHLLGYLGKMIEVTREAPANLGTAMKTIIARFEDMKKDPAALIDGASANKVEAALATIGIALRDAAGEFRPLQDVFDELGMAWQDLTRNQQAYIATVAAGSRQQSRFLAMMNNYPRTLELIRESQNSAGAALQQYETYQNSAAAASARLTTAWEKFYSKIVDSKMIVVVINNLTKLVDVMSQIGPAWTTAIATIGAHGINKIIKGNLISQAIEFFGQEIKNSAGEKLTLTIGSVFKNGIKLGVKEAFDKIDLSEYSDAVAAAGQIGAKKGLSVFGSLGTAIGGILPILGQITIAVTAIVLLIKLISHIIDENNKKIEKSLLLDSEIVKKDREKYEKLKKEKNAIEDNYKIYNKYKDIIVLTDEELEEHNNAVEALKEQYEDLIVITDEYGRQIILNTDDLDTHNSKLKEDTKEYEKQLAIAKLIAVQQSEKSEKKYGKGNKTYMQDWTVEQLTNSGFSQDEAEILDTYGEMYRNQSKREGTFTDFVGAIFNFNNKKYLKEDSLYNNIINDIIGTGKFNAIEQAMGFIKGQYEGMDNLVDTILKGDKEELQRLVNSSEDNLTEQGKAIEQVIKKYAQIALDAQEILEKQIKELGKSILISTIDEAESAINNSNLQNDIFNLYNNLGAFNNNEFLEQLIGDETDPKIIQDRMEEFGKIINDYVNNLDPVRQKSFHELSQKLLDPSLSPQEKEKAVESFRKDADKIGVGISKEMEEIFNQYTAGSTIDINRRKKLNEELNISNSDFLKQFNSSQLRIIDQFRTINTKSNFDLYKELLNTDYGPQLIKSLSTLEQDILDDPSIYTRAQEIMVNFFQKNFKLDAKDAYDTFQEMFGDVPEAAIEAASDAFNNAKDLILTEPTKALNKKQTEAYQELEATLGESLRYYIEINDQGEEYLSIAGRIAIFQKTAEKYENSLLAHIGQLEADQKQIKIVNENLTDEQQNQINLKQKEIELDKEKLKILKESEKYVAQTSAALNNIDYATGYDKNIKTIKDAQKEMLRANGVLDKETAKTLISMGTGYRRYLDTKKIGEDTYYTLTKENADLMIADQRRIYNDWVEEQRKQLDFRINNLNEQLDYFEKIASGEVIISTDADKEKFKSANEELDKELIASEKLLEDQVTEEVEKNDKTIQDAEESAKQFQAIWSTAYTNLRNEWNELAKAMGEGKPTENLDYSPTLQIPHFEGGSSVSSDIKTPEKNKPESENEEEITIKEDDYQKRAEQQVARIKETLERLQLARDELEILGPDFEEASKGSSKADDAMKKLSKTVKDLTDALEDLDDLLKDVQRDLRDITVDYNPFTDLFEAWEHEWDYYYNIKRLISQIGQQGEYIDNIISADYASSDQRLEAQRAKIGNLVAKMAANDTYITALRAGMSQTGVELMKEFGDYYKVDPNTGQLYQTDKNLSGINQLINQRKEEIYNLQKLQNEKENDLALENSKLDALEQEKSAYESILSTIESQYDSLKDNEDITADISALENEKATLNTKINITDASIDAAKQKIRGMEDTIEEIEIDITLKEQDVSKLEDYVDRMEDKVSEYEEYWETLNSTIAEQQELLQELNDIRKDYIDTSISTEKQLYDAIVENYQDEINEKKKQYDYLKQLDQDYLRSIKDNISKERQAREDANKQRSYQQNQQRAQLLQMDTSGAFRSELASLNKEIESQRQDLYDDLVDKQVEALEKEIDKRHELYDKEVAALEERLSYMQENAILLWESVNAIVAEGSDAMMAILENTTEYINSNELERMQLRNEWELNVKKTFEGTEQGVIDTLGNLIQAGNEFIIDKYPEVGEAIDNYALVFEDAKAAVDDYNSSIRNGTEVMMEIFDTFMSNWNNATNNFTGYAENWSSIIDSLIAQTDQHKAELESFYDEEGNALQGLIGSIYDYDAQLQQASREMYDDFIAERQRYRDELNGLIKHIQSEISAAISNAGNAIQNTANSIQISAPQQSSGESGGSTVAPDTTQTQEVNPGGPVKEPEKKKVGKYKAEVLYYENYEDKMAQRNEKVHSSSIGFSSYLDAEKWAGEQMQKLSFAYPNRFYRTKVTSYKKGGFANFTGPAWLDGTKSQPEAVLNAKQTKLFTSMVSSLERAAANNSNINSTLGSSYNIGDINTNINVEKLDNETDIDRVARQVENRIMKSVRNRVSLAIA